MLILNSHNQEIQQNDEARAIFGVACFSVLVSDVIVCKWFFYFENNNKHRCCQKTSCTRSVSRHPELSDSPRVLLFCFRYTFTLFF